MKKLLILAALSMFIAAPALAQDSSHRAPNTAVGESTATDANKNRGTYRVGDPNQMDETRRSVNSTRPDGTVSPNTPVNDAIRHRDPAERN